MLFLYYQSLQIRMGDEKVIEIKRKSLDRKKTQGSTKKVLLVSRNSGKDLYQPLNHSYSDSFFLRRTLKSTRGQIDRYHLYFQTAASPWRQEILRNDSFSRNSYKRGINHLYRGYNSIPLNSGKIIRQSESKFQFRLLGSGE